MMQRELIHMASRIPAQDQATALQFLQALKANNHPMVKQLQQQEQQNTGTIKQQLPGTRTEILEKARQAHQVFKFFADRADALLMLESEVLT